MTTLTRAWKDPAYRAQLTPDELAALDIHPAGTIDIADTSLDDSVGGVTNYEWSCNTCLTCGHSSCNTCFTCSGWPCD